MHGSPSVLVASAFLAAHVTVPDTSAGSAFSAWLTAFNTADREQLRAVMKQFREPHPVEGALDFRHATGGFDLKKVLESTPTRIRVLVQERDGDQMAEGQMEKDEDTPNLAKGYTGRNGPLRYNYDSRPMRGSPAGGGFSTCEDLLRFAAALTGHKLLDAEHTKLLTTGKPGTPRDDSYGYGFGVSNDGGVRSFGHGGGAPGINADLKIFPDSGYVIAVMGNLDPPAASRISDFVAARLPVK